MHDHQQITELPSLSRRAEIAYAFGDVIRKYRTRAKYNQRDLAERMGVNQNSICNWETDKRQPDAQTLRRLCLLLDIPLYEFFGIEDRHSKTVRAMSSAFWIFTVLWTRTGRKIWRPLRKP